MSGALLPIKLEANFAGKAGFEPATARLTATQSLMLKPVTVCAKHNALIQFDFDRLNRAAMPALGNSEVFLTWFYVVKLKYRRWVHFLAMAALTALVSYSFHLNELATFHNSHGSALAATVATI